MNIDSVRFAISGTDMERRYRRQAGGGGAALRAQIFG